MSQNEAIFPSDPKRKAIYEAYGYSAGIKSGDLFFVSGQVGSREDGTPEPDFKKQVELAFNNLAYVLKEVGCSYDDIVDVTTFHTDPENQFDVLAEVKQRLFTTDKPTNWTAVGVNWLAGFDFEIKVIARAPKL